MCFKNTVLYVLVLYNFCDLDADHKKLLMIKISVDSSAQDQHGDYHSRETYTLISVLRKQFMRGLYLCI